MISVDEALQTILAHVAPLGVERMAITGALGRVLAAEVRSPRDIPGFDNSSMDGYAVSASDIASASENQPVRLGVVETIGAGTMPTRALERGQAAKIMTGAPVPEGADAIVPVEVTRAGADGMVEILAAAQPGAFVRRRGEDVRQDETVMTRGEPLTPAAIGMLASLNRSMVEVYRRPRVAIVSTGDELVDIDQPPSGAQVVNSTGYGLFAAVIEAGGEATMLRVARDRPDEVRERFLEALACDVVFTTGGVSVGQFDYVKQVLDELQMRRLFHGVAQRPGRPLMFGLIGAKPVFGLPGNPVSTMVCFYLYARPALRMMEGRRDPGLPRVSVRCAVDINLAAELTEFVRVRLNRRDGELYATPTGTQGSGILSSLSRADALLIGPASERVLRAGSQATVLLLAADAALETEAFFEERRRHKN